MASIGTVQASIEIDAKNAIASLDSLGKTSKTAAASLGTLGAAQKSLGRELGSKTADYLNSQLSKIGLREFKIDDIIDLGKGALPQEKARTIFDGLRKEYASTMKAMIDDNRLVSWLPEKVKSGLAQAVTVFDLYRGKFREGTALFDFQKALGADNGAGAAASRFAALTKSMQGMAAIATGVAGAVVSIGVAAFGAIGGVSALWSAFSAGKNAVKEAENYESLLRRTTVQAEGAGNGYARADYDAVARDFSKYANVTRAEALEVAKSLTMVGNIGQKSGAKIKQGTKIGVNAIADLQKTSRMVVDFTALQGGDFRNGADLKKYADNLRIAFSSWQNFAKLSSNIQLFTEEQQKSIEKTKELRGESAALAEALGYLPENLAGAAERATTPLQKVWDDFKSNARTAFIGVADGIDLEGIAQKLGDVLGKVTEALGDAFSGVDFAGILNGIIGAALDIAGRAVDAFVKLRAAATDFMGVLQQSATAQGFADMLAGAADACKDIGAALFDAGDALAEAALWAADLLQLDEVFGAIFSTIGKVISVIGDLVAIARDGWVLLIATAQDLWDTLSDGTAFGILGKGIATAIDWFRDLYDKAVGFIGGIKNAIATMFQTAGGIWGFVKERAHAAATIAAGAASGAAANIGAGAADNAGVAGKIDGVKTAIDKMNKAVDGDIKSLRAPLKTWASGAAKSGGGSRGRSGGGGASAADKQADRDAKNADRYLKNLREQAQEINNLTKLERLRYDIETGAVVLSDEQLQKAREFASIIDNRVRMQRQERQELELATQALSNRREFEDAQNRVSDIGAKYEMPDRLFSQMQELRNMAQAFARQIEDLQMRERQELIGKGGEEVEEIRRKYAQMQALAEDAYKARVSFWQAEAEAVETFSHDIGANYKKGLLEVADWYSRLGSDIQSATTSWASDAADALKTFVRTGKMDFKSLADSIIDDIARIAAQQFISGLTGGFTGGWTGGGGSSSGGLLSGLFGFAKGIFGFSSGGYTGAGGKHTPAGIVHAGEYVINAKSTRKIAEEFGWDFLKKLNGYESGGYVAPLPAIVTSGGAGGLVRDSEIEVNIYNQTQAEVTARRNAGGGLDVFIKQAVDAVAGNIAAGGNVSQAMQNAFALSRGAGVQRVGF